MYFFFMKKTISFVYNRIKTDFYTMEKITLPLSFFCELILENLPISSSGHLAFFSLLFPTLGGELSPLLNHFAHMFVIITQGFFLIPFYLNVLRLRNKKEILILFISLFGMNVITVLAYFLKKIFMISVPLFFGFFITAFFLLTIDQIKPKEKSLFSLSWYDVVCFGIAQSIALLPGVSRFGSVLFIALLRGLSRYDSFILAIISNVFIATESFCYLSYQLVLHKKTFFMIGEGELLLLIVSLFFSMGILLFVYFLLRKKIISFLGLYVFFIGLLVFYLFGFSGISQI